MSKNEPGECQIERLRHAYVLILPLLFCSAVSSFVPCVFCVLPSLFMSFYLLFAGFHLSARCCLLPFVLLVVCAVVAAPINIARLSLPLVFTLICLVIPCFFKLFFSSFFFLQMHVGVPPLRRPSSLPRFRRFPHSLLFSLCLLCKYFNYLSNWHNAQFCNSQLFGPQKQHRE